MPSANVDLVRSIYAAWGRGDYSSVDWADPDIEFVNGDGLRSRSRGIAEMGRAWRDFLGAWSEFHNEAYEYRELDEERVLVLTYFWGRGKTSGLEVGQTRTEGASVFQFRQGKVFRLITWMDGNRALADLGLTPERQAANRSD